MLFWPSRCVFSSISTLYNPGMLTIVSRNTHPVLSQPQCCPFSLSRSYLWHILFTIDSDQLWHYASRSLTPHGSCPSGSELKPLGCSDPFVWCFTPREVTGPYKRYPKAKIQIFTFWQMQIPKISLCPVSFSGCTPLPSTLQHVY